MGTGNRVLSGRIDVTTTAFYVTLRSGKLLGDRSPLGVI